MGKRNKGEQKDYNVKMKKKRSYNADIDDVTEEVSCMESTGNGKNKKIIFDSDESTKIASDKRIATDLKTSFPKRVRNKCANNNEKNVESNKQNKKIIFTDDNVEGTIVTINNTRRMKNVAEEEPDDEEIDKFCDELDDEDNVQFDNWVKLIEAKLGPNEKK